MFEKLPWYIIQEILLFDSHFIYRKQNLICIDKITRDDERYSILSKIPRIYQISSNIWNVVLSEPITKKRYVLGYRFIPFMSNGNGQWEYFFHIFTYPWNSPDTMICFFSKN